MKRTIVIALAIIVIVAGGIYLIRRSNGGGSSITAPSAGTSTDLNANAGASVIIKPQSGATPQAIAAIARYVYDQTYADPKRGFSFGYPASFSVMDVPGSGNDAILVQDIADKIGLQIVVTPFPGGDIDITPAVVQANIPDAKVVDPQEVTLASGRQGLEFASDNAAFAGDSEELWFVEGGNLYQVSAYAEFKPFLEGLFATWKFK